jgi:hypothetical protein
MTYRIEFAKPAASEQGDWPTWAVAALAPQIGHVVQKLQGVRARRRPNQAIAIHMRESEMRLTKAALTAAIDTHAEMQRRPGEKREQALLRLAKANDPLLCAMYEESLSAPDDESMAYQADPVPLGKALVQHIEQLAKAHRARGLTAEQAITRVLAEDPSLYDRWISLD